MDADHRLHAPSRFQGTSTFLVAAISVAIARDLQRDRMGPSPHDMHVSSAVRYVLDDRTWMAWKAKPSLQLVYSLAPPLAGHMHRILRVGAYARVIERLARPRSDGEQPHFFEGCRQVAGKDAAQLTNDNLVIGARYEVSREAKALASTAPAGAALDDHGHDPTGSGDRDKVATAAALKASSSRSMASNVATSALRP